MNPAVIDEQFVFCAFVIPLRRQAAREDRRQAFGKACDDERGGLVAGDAKLLAKLVGVLRHAASFDFQAADAALANYHWLPSVRGDLLEKLGRLEEARAEFERAAGMTRNARERELLLERVRGLAH